MADVPVALPRVCIIGAGSSGIVAAKTFHERGIPFDCFEKSDQVGGNWVFKNKNGLSSAYRSLHINTSKTKMAYSDFPMPRDYPDYPHHTQIAKYFSDYVDHFGIRDCITFNTGVAHAVLDEERTWHVTLETGEHREYDALVVANGHHWDARWPEPPLPGKFDGYELHSHDYIDPTEPFAMRGKRVVIVGMGNSALDIACELGRKDMCEAVYLSTRRGYWVMPRYFGGHVLDFPLPHPAKDPPLWQLMMPRWMIMRGMQALISFTLGRPQDFGLPKPDHPFGGSHPAISQDFYNRIGSGDVIPKPAIDHFEGREVVFADGSKVEADVVIYCTGYRISFPFFDRAFFSTTDNDVALWRRILDPNIRNLFFVGLLQPLCAVMPLAEQQAKLIAAYLKGKYALPGFAEMEAERLHEHEAEKAHFVKSARHTIEVDCIHYTYDLRRELKRGMSRAAFIGRPLPVPARAPAVLRPMAAE
ncbi:MAG: NAD(P)-binding domain-containing protein [Alphaproteobacteria bacterium]